MKIESNNEDHRVSIEIDGKHQSARVYNCMNSNIYVDITDSSSSDSVEADLTIMNSRGSRMPIIIVDDNDIHIRTTGSWEKASLAAQFLAAAELLEPGILEAIKDKK